MLSRRSKVLEVRLSKRILDEPCHLRDSVLVDSPGSTSPPTVRDSAGDGTTISDGDGNATIRFIDGRCAVHAAAALELEVQQNGMPRHAAERWQKRGRRQRRFNT